MKLVDKQRGAHARAREWLAWESHARGSEGQLVGGCGNVLGCHVVACWSRRHDHVEAWWSAVLSWPGRGRNMVCCGKLASGQLLMTFYKWAAAVACEESQAHVQASGRR